MQFTYDDRMTDEQALLETIAANPQDDLPRLVYADWLEEHDRAIRAEFIRLECDIAQKQLLPRAMLDRHVDLFKRDQELRDNHLGELLGDLSVLPKTASIEFRRGFVWAITLAVEAFLRHAESIGAQRPLPRMTVTDVGGSFVSFLGCRFIHCVTEVRGYVPEPQFAVLESHMQVGIERMTWLEMLDLEACGIDDRMLGILAECSLPALVDLDLSSNQITDEGVLSLLQSRLPHQLRRLILGRNPISDFGAIELARLWPRDGQLEYLNLRFAPIGPTGHQALTSRFGGKIDLF
jgi:uncharacterized protein (TIGR02996 family)